MIGSRPNDDGLPATDQARARMVDRPLLFGRLDRARQGRLMVVEAPAGYGKSQLLTEWARRLREAGQPVAWLAGREALGEARVFIGALIAAVAGLADSAPAPGGPPAMVADLRPALVQLRQMISGRLTVVIDDFDLVSNDELDPVLVELVRGLGELVHWVIVSRSPLRPSLQLLWIDGEVAEIGRDDLYFTDAEIQSLFENGLGSEDLVAISACTEGWPVAVQLVRHYLRQRGGTARPADLMTEVTGDVARYLTKRVLATLPESERELLIQISFLDEFSGELVEAVTGLPDCWQALEELERSSLLIAGAARRGTLYRCHNLLREVMFAQLRRRGRKELVRLELAAAHWYRQAGDFTLAVRHAAAAEAFDLAARFVEESGAILYGIRYGAPALAALLQMVPPAVTGRYPRLMLAEVFLLAKDSRLNAAADLLHSVKLRVDAAKAERERTLERSLLRDLTIAEMTFVIYGGIDIGQIRFDLLEEEVASAAPENHWMRGLLNNVLCVAQYRRSEFAASLASAEASLYYYGLVRSSNGIGHMNVHLGIIASEAADPAGALGHYRQARAAFEGGLYSDLAGCAIAEAMEAEALYERGEFDESRQLCAAALAVAEGAETHYELMVAGYRTLSALVAVERGPQEAVRSLDMPLAFVRRRGFLQVERFLLLRRTELALMAGEATAPAFKEPEAAARMAGKSYALPVPGWREADLELRVEARLALNLGDGAEAVGMLTAHATTLERGGRIRSRVQTLTLLALAHAQEGLATEALKRLKEAVGLALHGRLVSPFVEAGRGLLPLLAQLLTGQGLCAADPAEVEFLNRIIKLSTRVNGAASGLFSERERDIVRLLIQGTNNKLIARALGISPDTVRFHLKHIYEKFGVSDRRVVAELAREHGLVA